MVEVRNGKPYGVRDEPAMDGYYMTLKEFAELHGVSEGCVRQWKHRGKLVTVTIDGVQYIDAKVQIRAKKAGRPPKRQEHYLSQ